jgi:hypothetical protein
MFALLLLFVAVNQLLSLRPDRNQPAATPAPSIPASD